MAASKAYSGFGTILSIGTSGGTPTYTAIAEIKGIQLSGSQNKTEDVTNMGSPGRAEEFIVTTLMAGEFTLNGNKESLSGDAGQVAMNAAFSSGAVLPFKIVFPLGPAQTTTGDTYTFTAMVEELSWDSQFDKAITFSAKLKVSGVITATAGS
jgi:predicted secreted protein